MEQLNTGAVVLKLTNLASVADVLAEQCNLYDENNLFNEVDELESELSNDCFGYSDVEDFPI